MTGTKDKDIIPQIGQIFCNADHRVVHQRISTSRIFGSLQILRNIPEKIQFTSRSPLYRIIIKRSRFRIPNSTYKRVWPEMEHLSLKRSKVQIPREFKTPKIERKFISLNNHPTCLVV